MITNGLVAAAMTVLLLVSRIGLGSESRGLRTWVAADLAHAIARACTIAILLKPVGEQSKLLIVTESFAILSIAWHMQAIRRVRGKYTKIWIVIAQGTSLALLYGLPAERMTIGERVAWMDCVILSLAAAMAYVVWPMRRFWGARIISAMMFLALALQSMRLVSELLGIPLKSAQIDTLHPNMSIEPLLLDLIFDLFMTVGFMLLMQERLRERIEKLVVTDSLTGILNRRGLEPPLERELANARRYDHPMSVVMLDLDRFKLVNDRYGHAMGDSVLVGFTARVAGLMRQGDLFGRWGGEEFVLILPGTPIDHALAVAERIRNLIEREPVSLGAPSLTVSGGIASSHELHLETIAPNDLLELADRRLYLAKRSRNCIVHKDAISNEHPRAGRTAST